MTKTRAKPLPQCPHGHGAMRIYVGTRNGQPFTMLECPERKSGRCSVSYAAPTLEDAERMVKNHDS